MSGFTSVDATLTTGKIGQLAYGSDADLLVRSYVLEDATAVVPGRGVVYDAANDSIKTPSAGGQKFMGVAFDDGSLAIEDASYAVGGNVNVPVLRRGQVFVQTSEAVVPTDAVYLQHTDGGGIKLVGTFRTDNDGGNAALVDGVEWAGVFASNKAILQVNQPA